MLNQTAIMQSRLSAILKVNVEDVGSLGFLIDNLRARQCHDKMLPPGISPALVDEIQAIVDIQKTLLNTDPDYTFLAIGRFVEDIWNGIKSDFSGKTSYKYRYYSGHDSTVIFDCRHLRFLHSS